MSNHPKRGLAVTHFRLNLKLSYRLRYTYSFQNCVPALAGTEYNGVQNRIGVFLLPRVPLCYALPGLVPVLSSSPVQLREGFPKGKAPKRRRGRIKRGAFEEMARLAAHQGRESYSHDGVRAAARPFVSFQGGAGGNRNPPAFLFRGPGGHSLFKREYPPGFSVPKRYSSAGNPGNLFGKTKRKWGFNPVRHSRTSPYQSGAFDVSKENVGCILRGKAALPAANRRLSTDHPGSAAYSCTGDRPGPGSARRWGWRGCGCLLLPRSGW